MLREVAISSLRSVWEVVVGAVKLSSNNSLEPRSTPMVIPDPNAVVRRALFYD